MNTGEVVTGTAERLATGDAVNVAQRLEAAAGVGEILLGEPTLALVRDAVDVESPELLRLKGKAEPVPAFRLLAVHDVAERSAAAPMVGRHTELLRLRATYDQALRDRSCQLFTVLGAAGVGKSRLAAEFFRELDARVVHGRCLSYGEGITYWPVVEVVKQLDAMPADAAAAAAIRSLLGATRGAASTDEIAWAFRKLLEEQAQETPLVCVFDDLHWGEQTLLDLVEHVADLSRQAPILLLGMARPELLDRRPSWGGGKLNATTVLLEPLDTAETEELMEALGGAAPELRSRIAAVAEGNPLFVEETLALVRESADGEVGVPPTIQALLAARLDQLEPAERSVLERGSVEGRLFHRSAVQALANGESELPRRLVSLVRKELVRPAPSQLPGDDAYRFRHLLIRDAAYDALPKAARAELHERFAAWLEERAPDVAELDEILGHHLERAALYRAELGRPDPSVAERAGELLTAAGRRALWRGDHLAAKSLLQRAVALVRPSRLDVHLELDCAGAQQDYEATARLADDVAERARAAGDELGEVIARIEAANARTQFATDSPYDELDALARSALPALDDAGDHMGLVRVWIALANVANVRGQNEGWARAAQQAVHHGRLAGARSGTLYGLASALLWGPTPADEALRTLEAEASANPHPTVMCSEAHLLALLGRFDKAWALAHDGAARYRELTGGDWGLRMLGEIAILCGDRERAAGFLREYCDFLDRRGARAFLSTAAPRLGRMLWMLGRVDEAERRARQGRELGDEQDVATQTLWRQAQSLVLAARGEHGEAESLAREAVAINERSDALVPWGESVCDLAEVLHAAGRTDEATAAFDSAVELFERKRAVAMVAQVRERLSMVRSGTPPS